MRNDESPLRRLIITILVVLLFALFPHMPKTLAGPSPTEPLLGSWSGQVRYGEESKAMSLRFALGKNDLLVAFFDLPDLKFRNLGPDRVRQFSEASYDDGKSWSVDYDFTYVRKQ